jgi:hypothetical protein
MRFQWYRALSHLSKPPAVLLDTLKGTSTPGTSVPKRILGWLIALTFGSAAPVWAQGIDRLSWMAGCWEQRSGGRLVQEQWMAPLGGLMVGMARTVVRDTAREHEFLRIESQAGRPTYLANPSGQAEAAFGAEVVTDSSVTFANPAHDFPQRIGYRRVGTDSLVARIEGKQGDRVRAIEFPMRRGGCR